jgi:light-regulated signal transduction histidine kinase (bacteriophytochrome)
MEKLKRGGKRNSGELPKTGPAEGRTVEELEKTLRQRTLQYQSMTQALEGFAYSVSHDLRAPLRSVTGFSEALLNEFGSALDSRAKDYVERICRSADRMGQMLDHLLRFSRTARSDPAWQDVNISKVAAEICSSLQTQSARRAVTWNVQPDLNARADEHWIRAVLEILFQNAWKFTTRNAQARIEFGLRPGQEPAYFVRDDGVGFDATYADRLFFPFQRLHPPDDFPGEGMGLAIARRIIGCLGGRMWAESQPGRGATFLFTLQN